MPHDRTCSVDGCKRPFDAHGFCSMHRRRWKTHGTVDLPTEADRFWAKVDKTDTCWLWTASTNPKGYGKFGAMSLAAHRYSYEALVGTIPEGMDLDHLCRVRHCVNPAHLEPVSRRENLMRGETRAAANVLKTHCPAGHQYDEAKTSYRNGQRHCRACARDRAREARRAKGIGPRQPRTHCVHGHPYDAENTGYSNGARYCKACNRAKARRRRLHPN